MESSVKTELPSLLDSGFAGQVSLTNTETENGKVEKNPP